MRGVAFHAVADEELLSSALLAALGRRDPLDIPAPPAAGVTLLKGAKGHRVVFRCFSVGVALQGFGSRCFSGSASTARQEPMGGAALAGAARPLLAKRKAAARALLERWTSALRALRHRAPLQTFDTIKSSPTRSALYSLGGEKSQNRPPVVLLSNK